VNGDPVDLLLDCDAGVDDLVAIAVAAMHPRSRLLAVSLVGGNVPTREGVEYARTMLELCEHGEIPVLQGLEGGGAAPRGDAADAGRSPEAASFARLRDIILGAESSPRLVATGSLTNVAALLQAYPQLVDALAEIVVLGGAFYAPGNMSPVAERNIYSDPEAAKEVLDAGAEVTLVPIDVSSDFTVPADVFEAFARSNALLHRYLAALLQPYRAYYRAVFDAESCPLHDPLAALFPLSPNLFELLRADVMIELRGEVTRGATVIDLRPEAEISNDLSKTQVVRAVDMPAAWSEIAIALGLGDQLANVNVAGGALS
jgi:purine nucleosidase